MKKLFVLGALALATLSMSAQDYSGKWFVGGNFNFKSENSNTPKLTDLKKMEKDNSFTVSPLVGYFIAPTLAVGGQLGFTGGTSYKGENPETAGKTTTNTFTIAPLVRQYLPLGSSGFNFFGQVSLPVAFGSDKTKANKGGAELRKDTKFDVNLQATIGFDYIINEKYSFETSMDLASIGFNSSKPKVAGVSGERATSFNADINPGEKIGEFKVGFKMLF